MYVKLKVSFYNINIIKLNVIIIFFFTFVIVNYFNSINN